MSAGDTRSLIKQAVENLQAEVPSLRQLKLVIRLELRARGDVPIWRVAVPGPEISKDPAGGVHAALHSRSIVCVLNGPTCQGFHASEPIVHGHPVPRVSSR